ncbi:DUF3298 and DUF4163 domain-containing protein [Algoriphagus litoralis]|uniref:DUF3298 and DUF4163 domain-containing protein n=1 Tax=Algoriphagus litoralis TaxID=2202829 RepID=UPI000DBAB050|nr:DUF3298 and DUF4163 domain-containing protein [Algoriphagus litoralis]
MRNLAIFLFVLSLSSCATKPDNLAEEEETVLSFRTETLERETCVGENCAKLKLSWPVASGARTADKINEAIDEQMSFLMQTGEDIAPLDTMIAQYFRSFEEFKREFPDSYGGWEIEATGELAYQSDSTLSIYFTQFNFMGGAHPNSMVNFLNFDPMTGEALSTDRVILDQKGVSSLAEQKFAQFHEVEEGVSLAEDGRFFLPETGFFLANAIGFKDDKFWVIYVPYEIGPYAMGYTELAFTKAELGKMVRW